jgi:DNA-binding GntR family transcriptional regulator
MNVRSPTLPDDGRDQSSQVLSVVDYVVEAVREGRLSTGQRLVESDFVRQLGVARSTVREAFQRLEAEGLLSVERHRGFLVRTLTRQRLREIYQVRASLDGLAARLAAPYFKADHAALAAIVDALETARRNRDVRAFTQANQAFHELIRLGSGNALISKLLNGLERSVYNYQFRHLVERDVLFDGQDEHLEIFRALARGDAEAAEAAARLHAERSLEELLKLPDILFGEP